MRRLLLALPLLAACHESELEPRVPDAVWQDRPLEATYALAPVPAIVDPAPVVAAPRRSISLGFVGDAPLTETPPQPPRWPYVQEPFQYVEPYETPYAFQPRPYPRRYVRRAWLPPPSD